MLQPHFCRHKTTAGREAHPYTITARSIEVERIRLAISIHVDILDLIGCRRAMLQPYFCRHKTTAGREAYPYTTTARSIEVQRICIAISIHVDLLSWFACGCFTL